MRSNSFIKLALFICLLAILTFVGCAVLHDYSLQATNQKVNQVSKLFSHDGRPNAALSEVLKKTSIKHDNTIATIVTQTQKEWLRPFGVERFEMEHNGDNKRQELWPLLVNVGLVNECYPSKKSYEYCLVLGATISTTRVRLAYVARLWNEGIRFKNLVLLTGARVLDPKIESVSALCTASESTLPIRPDWKWDEKNAPGTEAEMMQLVHDQIVLPSGLRNLGVTVIDAPQQMTSTGALRRPNTGDTLVTWLATNPNPAPCLVISNQPFVGYQDSVVRTVVPASFEIETVGSYDAADYDSTDVYLDSLARWLYQEQIRLQVK